MMLFLVQVAPLWMLIGGVSTPVSLTLVAVRIGTLFGTRRAYVHRGLWYWLSPCADIVAVIALVRGVFNRLVGRAASWRGRTYSR